MDKVADQKFMLRRRLLDARGAMPAEVRRACDAALDAHVVAWCRAHAVRSLAVYCAIRGEPDLAAAFETLAADGVALALPIVAQADAPLRFAAWRPGMALVKDAMGVPVPAEIAFVAMPQALLLPCVGFNGKGYRLGYGGGYYDRTLAQQPRPLAVGVAYAGARAEFDVQAHDVALDAIFTEEGKAV
jgi:5-formyltetrahydrofolate cyclo-ligase